MADRTSDATPVTSARRRVLAGVFAAAVIVAVFAGFLPALADYDDVWQVIVGISASWIVLVILGALVNQAAYPTTTMAALPGLTYRHSLGARLAATAAANTIPGGGAVGVGITFAMLTSWGYSGTGISAAVALTGLWNNAVKLGLPAAALVIAWLQGTAQPELITAAITGGIGLAVMIALVAVAVGSPAQGLPARIADAFMRIGARIMGRPAPQEPQRAVRDFVRRFSDAIDRRSLRLGAATLAAYGTQYLVLLACLRAVGVGPPALHWSEILSAFSVILMISAIPITPGGLGIAEFGLTALLSQGQADPVVAEVAAAVLLYRFLTFVVPTIPGAVAAVLWRIHQRRRRRSTDPALHPPPEHLEDASC